MVSLTTSHFDFSQDALLFKQQLLKRLQQESSSASVPLEDDDLEFVNAAGVPQHVPKEHENL